MLIIFDLDDTLIDTSGTVTPFKLRQCLLRLIEDGAEVEEIEKGYQELMNWNNRSFRSKEALLSFAASIGAPNTARALAELTSPLPKDFFVPMTPGALEILSFFGKKYPLALVTGGSSPFQREKMERAGLRESIFCRVAVSEDSLKKQIYENLASQFLVVSDKVWVCGDRVDMDLAPAHELGFNTIHMRWGRGKIGKEPSWIHHSISTLLELKGIIK